MAKEFIERGALDRELQDLIREYNRNCESDKAAGAFEALYRLRLAPAADVVGASRKRWIVHNDGTAECPECHTLGSPQWKCCPVCAVMMEGKETNNESKV